MKRFWAFWSDTTGATSIEYAMIGAGLSILIIGGARSIGTSITTLYINKISGNLT